MIIKADVGNVIALIYVYSSKLFEPYEVEGPLLTESNDFMKDRIVCMNAKKVLLYAFINVSNAQQESVIPPQTSEVYNVDLLLWMSFASAHKIAVYFSDQYTG